MTGLQTTLGENYKRPVNMLVLGVRVYIVTFFSCNFSISYIAACCAINCTKTVQKIFHTLQKGLCCQLFSFHVQAHCKAICQHSS